MKLIAERPFAKPETAARKLVEITAGIEPIVVLLVIWQILAAPLRPVTSHGDHPVTGARSRHERGTEARAT